MRSTWLKRVQLPVFFLLCLSISWAIWIPEAIARLENRPTAAAGGGLADMLAVWAPALVGALLSLLTSGRAGWRALLQPLRRWRVGLHWYLFALLYPAAVWLAARGIDTLIGRTYAYSMPILTYFPADQPWMIPIALVFAFPNTLGEEVGWRGFALPHLQARSNALASSLALGLFWGVWHIPLWMASGRTIPELATMVITLVAAAILFTWIYNNTGGSLLVAWLFHAATTITQYFLQPVVTPTDDILRWGVAALVVIVAGSAHLSRRHTRIASLAEPATA
jgi:membrane protease YdiL (CAAX protease family)